MTVPIMTNWTVAYNDHISGTGAAMPAAVDVYAAYYVPVPEGQLIEFKDSDHQVVFALHAGIVLTISRADATKRNGVSA